MNRTASVQRKTNETDITLILNIDGTNKVDVDTGIGFFDHMLTLFATHGQFDLTVKAIGDLDVDEHHTVEDVGLVLGQALAEALGDKAGIVRTAHAYVPMDETLARFVLDLSGRPYSVVEVDWRGSTVGGIATTLIEHFFESFSVTSKCNLHAKLLYGRDNHHISEALFKALGRSLDAATQIDSRRINVVPSTKGTLTD